jgi:hypothetical protein
MVIQMTKNIDHFTVSGYEVRFLQDAPVTVCVIRSLTDRHQKYTGISVCHPSDKWDEATGRHEAMKDAINNSKKFDLMPPVEVSRTLTTVCLEERGSPLPIEEIRRQYCWHYRECWKMKKMVERRVESK